MNLPPYDKSDPQYHELMIVHHLITQALERGMKVSVRDMGVKDSTDLPTILAALNEMEDDTVLLKVSDCSLRVTVYLVWGNGFDVIADTTASGVSREFDELMLDVSVSEESFVQELMDQEN